MPRASLKLRLLSLIAIIFAILLGVIFLIVWPTINKITELKKDIGRIEEEMEARYQNAYKLKRTLNELENIKQQAEIFKKATISRGQEMPIITQLESLAGTYNLEQTLNVNFVVGEKKHTVSITEDSELGTQPIKPEGPKNALPEYYEFSFLINGPFTKEIEYLAALDKLPYYTIIKQISWEKRQNNTGPKEAPITLTFRGIIYAQPETQN